MKSVRFDEMFRAVATGNTRRGVLASVMGGLLTALPFALSDGDVEAKKKRKRKKKRKHKKQAASPPAPPLASGPTTTADAACPPTATAIEVLGGPRFAQTFLALRGGQLTSASAVLTFNAEGADFDLEIRDVDQTGQPVDGFLARTTIAAVAATGFADPPRTLSATFGSPATVVTGQRYALVVTETSGQVYAMQAHLDANPCPDGNLFVDIDGNVLPRANDDLVFATFVTA